jgi:hypothetical protein
MFTDADYIHVYTRGQAILDGFLVDLSDVAHEAGFTYPVAITRAAYESCIEWTDADNERKGSVQDVRGRTWDVVYMASVAVRAAKRRDDAGDRLTFSLYVVPRAGAARRPRLTTLAIVCGPSDDGSPCLTIMEPTED